MTDNWWMLALAGIILFALFYFRRRPSEPAIDESDKPVGGLLGFAYRLFGYHKPKKPEPGPQMITQRMPRGVSRLISVVAWGLPASLVFTIGSIFGIGVLIFWVWNAVYVAWNLRFYRQDEWALYEKLGMFDGVKRRGPRFYTMLGIIDKIRQKGVFSIKRLPLFCERNDKDEITGPEEMDFGDESAPVEAVMLARISEPNARVPALERDVARYVYETLDDTDRVAINTAEDMLRPKLQEMTIDQANLKRVEVADKMMPTIATELREYGLVIEDILISDLVLSDETKKLRRQRLEEAAKADAQSHVGRGIRALAAGFFGIKPDKEGHYEIDGDKLAAGSQLWAQHAAFESLTKPGTNLNLFGGSTGDLVKVLNVAPTSTPAPAPTEKEASP